MKWETGPPPHNKIVEVEYKGKILKGVAIWGDKDKGILPHWELEGGNLHVHPSDISHWRYSDG